MKTAKEQEAEETPTARKRKSGKRNSKRLTITAMFAAVAYILMFLEINVPFMPVFIKFDISDLPAVLGTFMYGPICGIEVALIKNVLHLLNTTTGGVGEISNFVLNASFVLPTGIIYHRWNNRRGAVTGALAGAVFMALLSVVFNYFIVYPIYFNFIPEETVLSMYQAFLPGVDTILEALIVFNMPFTFLKGIANVLITAFLFKRMLPVFHMNREEL